jgi:hypothetical protein
MIQQSLQMIKNCKLAFETVLSLSDILAFYSDLRATAQYIRGRGVVEISQLSRL